MFCKAKEYFTLLAEAKARKRITVPTKPKASMATTKPEASMVTTKPELIIATTKPETSMASMAIKLAGNITFEQWYDNSKAELQSGGATWYYDSNDSPTMNSNPPLRLLRQSIGPHMCMKCTSVVDTKEVKQNSDFRLALQARLSSGYLDEVFASNSSTIKINQELPLSRSVVLEKGVRYVKALPMCQPGTKADQNNDEEHTNVGPESKLPNRLNPQEFPLYILACDHIICQACLVYNFDTWYQNAVCPMCRHELLRTGRFYFGNMMVDQSAALVVGRAAAFFDDGLLHKAIEVYTASFKANDKSSIILTTWGYEQVAHGVAAYLETKYPAGYYGHSSKYMTDEALSRSVQSSSVKHVLDIAHSINLQKLIRLHAMSVPCLVSVTGLKATMLRLVRQAVQEPIADICRRLLSEELIDAGFGLDLSSEEILEVATTLDGTQMKELWRVCEMFVEYTVAWLVWRHVTLDPDYVATLTKLAVPMGH
ncbi:hypothetical protein PtrSN002B_007511 [Pyrenophora tritici-repentis]|uniref:Zf-RING-2 domain containing protein n=3 Tax=Pyrenophora tritici-repentis TaxID=45151 RepID=A0A2W1ED40_9PLEO|nr:zf-RING-2 domain-containing protein [Pyrenophora tritici-repentis]KAF7569092.1 zf-RING-2 domain containing protein [Pyrenophora tritici-repentis]KAG9383107.1 zf-RING-2 domain containing protein [Pyrenophora tritici-repentis]KAI0588620.1 zf-RING-2 domain-containing protein [Pyrenophora tritici-repentis]KAI0614897.1 zf-RING-2 domain-containing protein [Pyrenophora tritici-repentis]